MFIVCQVEGYRNILKLRCRPLAFTSYKAFLKIKKRSGTSLLALFSTWFLKKIISLVIFCYLIKFHYLVALLREMLGNLCITIVCEAGCDFLNFEINFIFLIKPFPLNDEKVRTKIKIPWWRAELLKLNRKHSSFLKTFIEANKKFSSKF